MKTKRIFFGTLIVMGLLATGCSLNSADSDSLTASGTISAVSVNIAPEIGGKVVSINHKEGEDIKAGDLLFDIDSEYLQSQLDQANAVVDTAQAALDTAEVQARSANLQLELAKQNSRVLYAEAIEDEQRATQPGDFDLPVWYFSRDERIETAEALVGTAADELAGRKEELNAVLTDIVNSDFIDLEKELAEAQADYIVKDAALEAVTRASENTEMRDIAQDDLDLSETRLEDVQERYDQALDDDAAEDVLKARAAVGVAQKAYDEAVDYWMSFFIGDDALQVQAASAGAELAEMQVKQAETGLVQAQSATASIEIQLAKTSVTSPISGSVLTQNIETGELIGAGGVAMTVGNIDEVKLTVYIPEDKYGRVSLAQDVKVFVDSFPQMTYMGKVTFISESAEFTPSNVQTVEGRKATVFAVEITIENESHDLKPGMPADVEFLF